MNSLQEAIDFFKDDKYAMVTSGIEIVDVADHYAKCSMKIDDRHQNAVGHVMGGAIYTLADFVFAVSTNSPESTTVTTVSQISYLGSPKGDTIIGESTLLKDGRRTCFYRIDIKDNLGNDVAVVNTNGTKIGV